MSGLAAETTLSSADFRALRIQLVVHAAGGLLVLLAATMLSVYKPWGMTPYGRRKRQERRKVSQADLLSYPALSAGSVRGSTTSAPLGLRGWVPRHRPGLVVCRPASHRRPASH